jgi:hypothetical protein
MRSSCRNGVFASSPKPHVAGRTGRIVKHARLRRAQAVCTSRVFYTGGGTTHTHASVSRRSTLQDAERRLFPVTTVRHTMDEVQTSSSAPGRDPVSNIIEPDRMVQLAILRVTMREQGFSERSITKVLRRAQRMLDALEAQGVAVPRPRVFDPGAPSIRTGDKCAAPQRHRIRELESAPPEPSPPAP